VAADSNLRQEALGSLLVAKKVIDDRQLEYLLAETKSRGQKMGTVLVELGWMTPEDVLQYLAAQARKRISDCLRWQEGNFSFTRGDTFGERVMEHDLDTPRLIFTGLYRTAVADDLVARLDEDAGRPVRLLPALRTVPGRLPGGVRRQILDPLHEGATLGELVIRDDGRVLAVAIESLLAAGLAELAGRRSRAPTRAHRRGVHPRAAGRADRRPLPRWPRRSPTRSWTSSRRRRRRWRRVRAGSQSGMVQLHHLRPISEPSPSRPAADGRSPQRVLRSTSSCTASRTTRCWGCPPTPARRGRPGLPGKSARLPRPPSRLTQDADAAKLEALREAYERAWKALSDPSARVSYDSTQMPAVAPTADPLGAELAFREGTGLLEREDASLAIASFERAVAGRPDQAAYHAYLGWAQFQARGLPAARGARDHLSHALALDPDLAKAHEFLGRIAVKENDTGTGRRHLERRWSWSRPSPSCWSC
jgi:Flp pilus assembly protein TadD